jgi:hypothetical protein
VGLKSKASERSSEHTDDRAGNMDGLSSSDDGEDFDPEAGGGQSGACTKRARVDGAETIKSSRDCWGG